MRKADGIVAIDAAVGARVRVARKSRGLSQTALAEKLGVSFQQVQKLERGSNRFTASKLIEIGRALALPPETLLRDADAEASDIDLSLLSLPGALELMLAYRAAPEAVRPTLLQVARELSKLPSMAKKSTLS